MAAQKIKVDGISVFAKVQKPDDKYGKYVVNLVVDEVTAAKLSSTGLQPSKDRSGNDKSFDGYPGKVYKFSTKEKPMVVDSKGNEVDCLIGNGSKIRCYGAVSTYTNSYGTFTSAFLNTVQIIDLVEYQSNRVDIVEDGFVAGAVKDMDLGEEEI